MSAARPTTPKSRLTRDGRILGVKDVFLHDTGAYNPYGLTVPINSQCTLLGPYVVPNYDSTFTAIFTNKPIVTPYRGAGRQHGVFVIERLLDIAAHELEDRPRRNPPPQSHSARRIPLQQRDHLSGLRAALIRQRQLRADPRQGAGDDRLHRHFSPRSSRGCARKAATSASASPATSKAPASVPMKAPRCRCRPTARSAWRPASAPRGRGISPSSPRSSPISSASRCATSMSSPAIPISSIGAPAPSPAAARWWPAMPSTKRPKRCGRKS